MYCKKCGKEIDGGDKFCPNCGEIVEGLYQVTPDAIPRKNKHAARCPKCGSTNVDIQIHQEQNGGSTVTKTKTKIKQKGHGFFWWLLIGWWWWIIDLALWTFLFPVRFLIQLFKKKKYVGDNTSVSKTNNRVRYKTVCLCKTCGHHWEK